MAGYDYSIGATPLLNGKDVDRINDLAIYSSMINRYFDPELYNKYGYMSFVSVTEDVFSCYS